MRNAAYTENTTDEGGVRMMARGSTYSYDFTKSFSEQIKDWKNGNFNYNDSLLIGKTPAVYIKIGLNPLPVTINQEHVDYAVYGIKDQNHYFDETMLEQLPVALEKPIAVFASKSNTKRTRLVALLSFTKNGNNVIAPIEIDGYGVTNGISIDSNAITSVYARNNSINMLKNAFEAENNGEVSIYYYNKKETIDLFKSARVTMPKTPQTKDGFIHSIRDNKSPVKTKYNSIIESQQFKRWFGNWQKHPGSASKVVDSNGKPLVVYHGTTADFDEFAIGDIGYHVGTREQAEDRVKGEEGAKILSLYARIKNPLEIGMDYGDWSGNNTAIMLLETEVFEDRPDVEAKLRKILEIDRAKDGMSASKRKDIAVRKLLQSLGYDGIKYENTFEGNNRYSGENYSYIAFEPTQLKSATDNIGTYDGSNSKFRYQSRNADTDADYLSAVERGDMQTAQKMVDKAAYVAGPVTYDDEGNIIPLSERFNSEEKDIRYQDRAKKKKPFLLKKQIPRETSQSVSRG